MKLIVMRTAEVQFDFSRTCMRLIKEASPEHLRNHFRPATGLNFKFKGYYDDKYLTLGVVEWHGSDSDLLYFKLQDVSNIIYSVHDLSDAALAAYAKLKYVYHRRGIRLDDYYYSSDRVKYDKSFDIVTQDMKVK